MACRSAMLRRCPVRCYSVLDRNVRHLNRGRNPKLKRTSVIPHSFLPQIFKKKSDLVKLPDNDETEDLTEYEQLENEDEIVLMETTQPDGTVASFIYKNGGLVDAVAVNALCMKVGWPSRSIEKLAAALENGYLVSSIYLRTNGKEEEDRLIGLGRATSDHCFNATIWDVMIDPEFQKRGLGKCLLEKMVRTLLRKDITNIALFADKEAIRFYEKVGFEADPEGIKGMFWYPAGFSLSS